jgi:hypothetical protein
VLSIALIDELISVIRGNKPGYADAGESLLDQTDNESAS